MSIAVAWCATVAPCAAEEMPSAAPLFAAALVDAGDRPATLDRFKGKAIAVNFWARWCGPCRDEIPEFVKARKRFRGRGIEVVGIALDDNAAAVKEFAAAYGIDYPVFLVKDRGIELIQSLGNPQAGLPFTLVLDAQGRVVYKKLGVMKAVDMDAAFAMAVPAQKAH
jgi:thiol-disulfide isomerase/thioredoxin